jgi:cellulose synthase operon protein C
LFPVLKWRHLLLSLSICALSVATAADPKVAGLYEDALQRFEKKDIAGAIIQLKNALQVDKRSLPVHVLLGRALLSNGDVIGAEVAFAEALSLGVDRAEVVLPLARSVVAQGKISQLLSDERFNPAGLPSKVQVEMMLLRASALSDLGRPREALALLGEARALDGDTPGSWLIEVPIRIKAQQFKEANFAAERALKLAPESAEVHYLRASVAHTTNRLKEALEGYDKALKLDPAHQEALLARAGLLLDLKRAKESAAGVAEFRRLAPRDPRGAYLAALAFERAGDKPAAAAALREVTAVLDGVPIEFIRFRPQALIAGGLAHYGLGELEKALPYLEMLHRQHPSSPGAKLLAQIHLSNKNDDSAVQVLESYLRSNPRDGGALILLATAQAGLGRSPRATQILQDGLKIEDSARVRAALGLSLMNIGKPLDALTHLEAAFRKDPSQLQAGTVLASVYLRGNQLKKAHSVVETLLKQGPDNPGFHNLAGLVAAASGDAKQARAAFEQALRLNPKFAPASLNLAKLDVSAGALDAAIQHLQTALEKDEQNTDLLMNIAVLAERKGLIADATRLFQKAAELSGPSDVKPGRALVAFLLRNKKVPKAQEAAKQLMLKAPEDTGVLLSNASASLASGDLAGARAYLTRANRSAGADTASLIQCGLLQLAAGDPAGAAYSAEKVLQVDPDNVAAMALAADTDIKRGDLTNAELRARSLIKKLPKSGVGHALLGDIAMAGKQPGTALGHFQRAHQLDLSGQSFLRFFSLQAQLNPRNALVLGEQWLKSHPQDVSAWRAFADAQARSGNMKAAGEAYAALVSIAPGDAEALNNYAQVLLASKDSRALSVAESALALSPGVPHILGTTGWAALQAGATDRAIQLLREARLRDPNNSETRYYLARALASVGRAAEARDELQAALRNPATLASAKEAQDWLQTLK